MSYGNSGGDVYHYFNKGVILSEPFQEIDYTKQEYTAYFVGYSGNEDNIKKERENQIIVYVAREGSDNTEKRYQDSLKTEKVKEETSPQQPQMPKSTTQLESVAIPESVKNTPTHVLRPHIKRSPLRKSKV